MERFPVELLFALGFIAFVLFNYLTARAARRRQEQEPAQAEPPPPADEEILDDIWGRTAAPPPAPAPAPVLAPRAPAAPVAAPAPARRSTHPVRALLQDKRDLRRAVVLMMVLGPCRAFEPPER